MGYHRPSPVTCKHGHPYVKTIVSAKDRYGDRQGYARCRTCHDTYMREYARRRRAEKKSRASASRLT